MGLHDTPLERVKTAPLAEIFIMRRGTAVTVGTGHDSVSIQSLPSYIYVPCAVSFVRGTLPHALQKSADSLLLLSRSTTSVA